MAEFQFGAVSRGPSVTAVAVAAGRAIECKRATVKAEHVLPLCELTFVAADLSEEWSSGLRASGFDSRLATTWVLEGVLPYLSAEDQARTLTVLAGLSSSGSHCVLER